jgi:hypothetical protein
LLVLPGQGTQSFGQSEGQHKILGWQLFVELSFQPLLAFIVLAMRTIAMSTGMRDENLFFTATAKRRHDWALSGSTLFQRWPGLIQNVGIKEFKPVPVEFDATPEMRFQQIAEIIG